MAKKIVIVTLAEQVAEFYRTQLKMLFGDLVEVYICNIDDRTFPQEETDLYLVSTTASESFERIQHQIPSMDKVVIADITITREALAKLKQVKRGTKAILVNLNHMMSMETVALLHHLGVNNIEFTPFYPGLQEVPQVSLAITPAEQRFVPPGIRDVLDIGHRVLDTNTIIEIALKLGFDDLLDTDRFRAYFASIVTNNSGLNQLFGRSEQLESQFEILIDILDTGIIGVNGQGMVFACNERAARAVGMRRSDILGKDAAECLPFIPFDSCREHHAPIKSQLIKVGDVDIDLTIAPVVRKGIYLGAFAIVQRFKEAERRQHKLRMQLMDRGHVAKYTFDDIVGVSPKLEKAKSIAQRIAKTDSSILITGESGTGKELFAHAIHNASGRRAFPFVAVNCAAIAESLLESELFGYEEGSFTGARKGGKLGLFEYAHQGTLFLDEIEAMSTNLQMKLLRVLQEKEVMRVGGDRIIHVDVRIIAATNEDLRRLMENGAFRKDLYYRLNTLPVQVPPLREHPEDILPLIERMKQQLGSTFLLTPEAKEALLHYSWDGNIRELRNCVEYITYLGGGVVTVDDLPGYITEHRESAAVFLHSTAAPPAQERDIRAEFDAVAGSRQEDYRFALRQLYTAGRNHRQAGRKSLAGAAARSGLQISEQEMRTILRDLERLGLVKIGRGRGGSKLTTQGIAFLEHGQMTRINMV